MRPRSSLAALQRLIMLSLLAVACAWLAWHWQASAALALGGFALAAFGYVLVLGIEFILLRATHPRSAVLTPSWGEIARAWLAESLQAPQVFCWRQPFFWDRIPDQLDPPAAQGARRGVVFIHGFFCNRGFWTPWLVRLRREGRCFSAVNLEPVFGSIDDYAGIIDRAVADVTLATGLAPVLVCHSMGGLAARAWLRTARSPALVHHVVTIGTPHGGTWLARFSRMVNGRQMVLGGEWLGGLTSHEATAERTAFTCWYSNCDNIVFPVLTATLPDADNRLVRGAAHVDLAFRPEVMTGTIDIIRSSDPG